MIFCLHAEELRNQALACTPGPRRSAQYNNVLTLAQCASSTASKLCGLMMCAVDLPSIRSHSHIAFAYNNWLFQRQTTFRGLVAGIKTQVLLCIQNNITIFSIRCTAYCKLVESTCARTRKKLCLVCVWGPTTQVISLC